MLRPLPVVPTGDNVGDSAATGAAGYELPDTERFALFDRAGREFSVFVAHPRAARRGPLPALHLLDANASFGTMVEAVRLRGTRPDVSGVGPAWVVGIGYPTDQPLDIARRSYDYTPPSDGLVMPDRPGGEPWPQMGGADRFMDFIEAVLKPELERRYRIGAAQSAVFGHSFGGLCVLHMLFTRAALFDSYVAASPSIWWNNRFILREEQGFLASDATGTPPRLLLMSGSEENRGPFADDNGTMVREMAVRLVGSPLVSTHFHEFAGEDHGSVLAPAIGRAVGFVCSRG
jgi:predicted alpha/beta superfamily hydrolase